MFGFFSPEDIKKYEHNRLKVSLLAVPRIESNHAPRYAGEGILKINEVKFLTAVLEQNRMKEAARRETRAALHRRLVKSHPYLLAPYLHCSLHLPSHFGLYPA